MRRGRAFGRLVAAMGVFASSPAFAQLRPEAQTGSLTHARPQAYNEQESGALRKEFGQCVYRRSKARAAALLAHSDLTRVNRQAAGIQDLNSEFQMEDCLEEVFSGTESALGLRFDSTMLRDLMAEESYLAQYRSAPSSSAPMTPIVMNPTSSGRAQALATFSDCTIRNDLGGADALLRTIPGSPQERQVATRLAPALGRCLVAGQQLRLTPGVIRGFMAFAMWSRFVAPTASSAGAH